MINISKLPPISKIALARDTKLKIKPVLKFLLVILISHLGGNEYSFPSIDTLMFEMEIGGRRHIIKYLNELEKLSLIKKSKKNKRSNQYHINFDLINAINLGMVPPWEPVPTGELKPVPFSTQTSSLFDTNQFPRGNSKALKDLKENKQESSLISQEEKERAEEARKEIRRICKIKSPL